MISSYRGHVIKELSPGFWIYVDRGIPVSWDKDRPCGHCGLANTPEGHDGCLGTLPGVMNACCGHGDVDAVYIQMWNGESVHGLCAKMLQEVLKVIDGDKMTLAEHERWREMEAKAEALDAIIDYLSRPSPADENRQQIEKLIAKHYKPID